MTAYDMHGRPNPPLAAGEAETLLGFLEFHRETLAWKVSGLDAAGLAATVGASTMTLGGLLKHMAGVEDWWFSQILLDHAPAPAWDAVDWDADIDWDWHSAADDTPDELLALWRQSVESSRANTTVALAGDGLATMSRRALRNGKVPSLRWIVVHMVEEYARHNGHADLIRESVDGAAGV